MLKFIIYFVRKYSKYTIRDRITGISMANNSHILVTLF